jgi:hypothetical protein
VVLATAVLAGTGLVGPAPVAKADVPGYEVVEVLSAQNSNLTRRTTASCTGNNELVGMGAYVFPHGSVLIESIVPDLTTESVEVSAREDASGTTASWGVYAIAVCAQAGQVQGRYLETDVDVVDSQAAESASAIADCDPGDRTLSAGFEYASSAGRINLVTLLPTPDSAMAVGQEDQAGTTAIWSVEVIALCAEVPDAEIYWDSSFAVRGSMGRTHWTECPEDYRVVGVGGHAWDEFGEIGTLNLYSFRPREFDGLDWSVVSHDETDPQTANRSTLYGYVICLDLN